MKYLKLYEDFNWRNRVGKDVLDNPFEEGVPNADKVKKIKEWLSKYSDPYDIRYVKFYHATDSSLPIEEVGLLPTSNNRRRSYQSSSGYVYLACIPSDAKLFGDLGNMSRSVVYEVVVRVIDLKADTDQLINIRGVGTNVGNSVAESIVYGRGVRVKGKIDPWQIRKY